MRVVLREAADAREAVDDAAALEAMQPPEVRDAPRQLAVAAPTLAEDEAMAGAVHRLQRERLELAGGALGALADVVQRVGRRREVHVLPVARQVPAGLEETPIEDLRRDDLFVAVVRVQAAHVRDELVIQERATRQEDGHGRRPLVEREEIELFSELSVIPRAGLGEHLQVGVELFLGRERRPVDALEHRVLLVAAPVRARDAGELHDAERLRRGDVGTAAEVEPLRVGLVVLAVPVDADLFPLGDRVDELELVPLAHALEEVLRLLTGHGLAVEGQILRDDPPHLLLDLAEVLIGEGTVRLVEVVIEAVLDRRTDGHLRPGEQALHCLRHHVRRRVTDELERCRIVPPDDVERLCRVDRSE